MPGPPYHARYGFAYPIAITIGSACLATLATLTRYTAKPNKPWYSSPKEDFSDQLTGVGSVSDDSNVSRPNLTGAYGNISLSFEVFGHGQVGRDVRNPK